MRKCFCIGIVVIALQAICRPTQAWNDAGHMIAARIAWNRLTAGERESAVVLLRRHPHYRELLLEGRPSDATEAEWIFLRAAVWADHVRPAHSVTNHELSTHEIYKFHRPTWHYINFPYRAGQTESILPAEPIPNHNSHDSNILQQIDLCMRILLDIDANDPNHVPGVTRRQNQAIRLCWLLHLVGDLHQPLHVATLVDELRFPRGSHSDSGGNSLMIRSRPGASPHTLHSFWDDRLGTNSHFESVCDQAEILIRDPRLAIDRLPELANNRTVRDWAAEGYQYAISTVYHDGRLAAALTEDFEHHRIDADQVPVLPEAASTAATNVVHRRIVLAGLRLSNMLNRVFSQP